MFDPSTMSPGSIMPRYPWLLDTKVDTTLTPAKIRAMQTLGVPYEKGYDAIANQDLVKQEKQIKLSLADDKIKTGSNKEVIALIAYLQRLGKDIDVNTGSKPVAEVK